MTRDCTRTILNRRRRPIDCHLVADYFRARAGTEEDAGADLTHLKLQKLLYYTQGFHPALYDSTLFAEPIEAWTHGPVIRDVWNSLKRFGSHPLPPPESFDLLQYPPSARELLDDVYTAYGQFSAWKLRNMTHEEAPWKNTPLGEVIPLGAMKEYFKTLVIQ